MLTLEETLEQQKDLDKLCCDRPLYTKEIFGGNAFYGNDKIIKLYTGLPLDYPLKLNIEHGVNLSQSIVWDAEINSILPVLSYKFQEIKKAYQKVLTKNNRHKELIAIASPIVYLSQLIQPIAQPKRKRRGSIFFPSHSTHHVIAHTDWEQLAFNLTQLSSEYHPITVCVYWKDYLLGRHIPFQKQNLTKATITKLFFLSQKFNKLLKKKKIKQLHHYPQI